jgi:hypothetical protein
MRTSGSFKFSAGGSLNEEWDFLNPQKSAKDAEVEGGLGLTSFILDCPLSDFRSSSTGRLTDAFLLILLILRF